ncbi:f15e9906-0d97-4dad-b303-56a8bf175aa8 [Thermothielavioides terrestris]|uniref:Mitotic checkpoint regulator, MAD2B-interacting-domain-containing protein n=2 Tax=Thermothielavioides terrestris TaxID=2587410 RepID=G2RBU1_THETT|nr:uncharacterized protein THITE_2119461 [Thermothielavioides terrestris NRRL 8126]AEO69262.1 hypothetical protein THITE_2119461 [Thermothielavioides terrestris NRRL 8126]SPQ22460.1 f15e9906-0d97-4dad-b303-56a8bf175aa8 [Thermothielavioides terrestris]
MGLVDYSDSESEPESVQPGPVPAAAAAAAKKPFQKLLDRSSGSGKIVVSLPAPSAADETGAEDTEQPPAKRAKTSGGSRFSNLGSFLPPPKKKGTGAPAASAASGRSPGAAPAPGFHLRTAAEPAFARGDGVSGAAEAADDDTTSSGADHGRAGPSIPEGQKPEEEVKLVGKPLMFKPLSVARKKAPAKPKKKEAAPVAAAAAPAQAGPPSGTSPMTPSSEPTQTKKISLFSIDDDDELASSAPPAETGAYEPLFTSTAADPLSPQQQLQDGEESAVTSAYPTTSSYQAEPATTTTTTNNNDNNNTPQSSSSSSNIPPSLSTLSDSLSPAARRELFGRAAGGSSASALPPNAKVVSFDMAREYAHNETLRASAAAAQQAFNPVRAIAPGKHSLRQVVAMAQSNQSALEESFARARSNQRDAAGRYGWK